LIIELEGLKENANSVTNINTNEAPDAGIITLDSETITLKQAKYIFENQKETDNDVLTVATYEIFVMRCYMDSIEMISRYKWLNIFELISYSIGNLLVLTADHSDYTVPEKLRAIGKDIVQQISLFRKPKRLMSEVVTPKGQEPNGFSNTISATSLPTEDDQLASSDLNDAFQAFIARFGDHPKKASEFVDRLRQVDKYLKWF